MPMRRRMRSTSTPVRGDLLALDDDAAGVDRLEQVDAAQQRRLARPRRADEAHDLVLLDGEVDALAAPRGRRRTCAGPRCAAPRSAPVGLTGASSGARRRWRRRSRATSQSTNRAIGIVSSEEEHRGHEVGREVERRPTGSICARRKTSTAPMNETSAVSFIRPMKSLSSGGMTRRTACGSTT